MSATITPMERHKLPEHVTNEPEIREKAQALSSRMGRIARVLTANAALPEMRRAQRDELVALAREALMLREGL